MNLQNLFEGHFRKRVSIIQARARYWAQLRARAQSQAHSRARAQAYTQNCC